MLNDPGPEHRGALSNRGEQPPRWLARLIRRPVSVKHWIMWLLVALLFYLREHYRDLYGNEAFRRGYRRGSAYYQGLWQKP